MRAPRVLPLLLLFACAHGEGVPDAYTLALNDTRGAHISLEAYRGQVILLNFFATWCFFDVSVYNIAQERYGPKGLQVLGVGLDLEGEVVLEPFRKFYELSYPILVGTGRFTEPGLPLAPIVVLPTSFLIGRDGKVLEYWQGSLDPKLFDKAIVEALRR